MSNRSLKSPDLDFSFKTAKITGEGDTREFAGIPYSGDLITDHPFWGQDGVVFDLDTLEQTASVPVLEMHDGEKIVGVSKITNNKTALSLAGTVFTDTPSGSKVVKAADKGFPWQMSVFIIPTKIEKLKTSATVNGRQFKAGTTIFRGGRIREVSFTPTGADHRTSATVFSMTIPEDSGTPSPKEFSMTPEELKALTDRLTGLETSFAAQGTKVASLEAENATLRTSLKAQQDAAAAASAKKRAEEVKILFASMGREYTEDAAKPYIGMEESAFSILLTEIKAIRDSVPKPLFRSQFAIDTPPAPQNIADQEKFNAEISNVFSA